MTLSRKKFPGAHVVHVRSGKGTHLLWANLPRDRYAEEKLAAEMEVERVNLQASNINLSARKDRRLQSREREREPLRRRPGIATDRPSAMNHSLYATPPAPSPNPNAPQARRADNPKIERAATSPVRLDAPQRHRVINFKAELSGPDSVSSTSIMHPSRSQFIQHSDPPPELPRFQPAPSPLPDPHPKEKALPTPPQQPEETPSLKSPLPNPFPDVSTSASTSISTSKTIEELQQQVEYWHEQAEFQSKQTAHQKELRGLKDREIAALRELLATAEEKVRAMETGNATALTEIQRDWGIV